jgi:hypothetical protein
MKVGHIHLLENDALGVGGATEGRETESSAEGLTLVVLIGPTVLTASGAELASGLETSWFSFTYSSRQGGIAKLYSPCQFAVASSVALIVLVCLALGCPGCWVELKGEAVCSGSSYQSLQPGVWMPLLKCSSRS